MPSLDDITARRFGRLVVVGRRTRNAHGRWLWLVRCDCGTEKLLGGAELKSGNTSSCGCLKRETIARVNRTHGHSSTPEFHVWREMWNRCTNPTAQKYRWYGALGIRVCKRWESFETFVADMGPRPAGYTLDRKDNDGHYEPRNCRWATRSQQQRNKGHRRPIVPLVDAS